MSPIYINNKKIESIYTNNQSIGKVYVGDVLVFQKNNVIPFIFTIDTTLGNGSSFDLPLRDGFDYDFIVDWGDGSSDIITSYNQTKKLHTYSTSGEYQVKITGICEAWNFNYGGDKLKLTSIDQWGNTGFINMGYAFAGCSNLTIVNDIDGTWCSSVTDMFYMFYYCSSLTTLDVSNWNVSNVTSMDYLFRDCSSLTPLDVSKWDVSNVISMNSMFENCSSLETLNVSNWNVSNVTNMSFMFSKCTSLTTLNLNNWNVSKVTNMNAMFQRCSSLETLDVSNWNVSNVRNMSSMFYNTLLDTTSYDALLIGWSQLPSLKSNVEFNAILAKYNSGAATTARQHIIDTYGWTIIDAGQVI